MVATMVRTIYTRENGRLKNPLKCISWSRPSAQGKIKHFLVYNRRRRKFFHYSETVHTVILSLLEIWGVTPTVGGTLGVTRREKIEGSPPQWGWLFWRKNQRSHPPCGGASFGGEGDSWGGLGGTNTPTRKWSMYIPILLVMRLQ